MKTVRGTALITVLLAAVALFVTAASLVAMAHGRAFAAREQYQRAQLQSLLKSAVAHAQNELAKDPDWKAGFKKQKLPGMDGTYSIAFANGGAVEPDESINNLDGAAIVDGPRGQQTVPAQSVDLVVIAEAGGQRRRAEVLLRLGPGATLPSAVAATNRIRMVGETVIRGENNDSEAGLHSNFDGDGAAITWRPLKPSDHATVSGLVSASKQATSDSDPAALRDVIDFGVNDRVFNLRGGVKTGVPKRNYPMVPVEQLVNDAIDPAKTPVRPKDLAAAVSGGDGGQIPLKDGKFLADSDLNVDGDLLLRNAQLYIKGNLNINGSISGAGTLYVTGDTNFQGDSEVNVSDPEHPLTICSKGSVTISGFSGEGYLNGHEEAKAAWELASAKLSRVSEILQTAAAAPDTESVSNADMDELMHLSNELSVRGPGGSHLGLLGQVESALGDLEPGPTKNKMTKSVKSLYSMFLEGNDNDYNRSLNLLRERRYGDLAHIMPALAATKGTATLGAPGPNQKKFNVFKQATGLSFSAGLDSMGRSNFTGVIYSSGSILADNSLRVRGAIWANGGEGSPRMAGDMQLMPGDIVLRNGVSLIYDDRFSGALVRQFATADQSLKVAAWIDQW